MQSLDTQQTSTSRLISESADRPGDDPIFALNAEAKRRAQAGEDVLNSTLGALMLDDGHIGVMPTVFEAYQRVDPSRAAAYAPISGPPAFLSAVIDDLFPEGPLRESAVGAATPGGTGACHHSIVNFLEPGQSLLTTSYFWGPYEILASHTRRGVETFEMFAADGGFNIAALEEALDRMLARQGRALVILNSPCHNPTGFSLNADDWNAVAEMFARAAGRGPIAVLLDLAYSKFAAPGSISWPSFAEQLLGKVTLLFAWTASKAFAQYGARVGACVAAEPDPLERDRIGNALGFSCRGTWSNCNHMGMLAVTELLTDPELAARCEGERAELRRLLQERVELFNQLAPEKGLSYPRYEGGFFVTVFTADGERTAAVMRDHGVFVVPAKGAVRVAICSTPAAKIQRLVDALDAGVRAAGG